MTDAEKVAILREALAPFVHALTDSMMNGTPVVTSVAFYRHAAEAMRVTDTTPPEPE